VGIWSGKPAPVMLLKRSSLIPYLEREASGSVTTQHQSRRFDRFLNDRHLALVQFEPSSRTGLLPSSPLRTVHESFPSHSSNPLNASFRETRFRDRKALVVNPVMALRIERGFRRRANHPSRGERSGEGASTRQTAVNLAQRMRPSHLAKQHRHELAPTGETPRVPFGLVCLT